MPGDAASPQADHGFWDNFNAPSKESCRSRGSAKLFERGGYAKPQLVQLGVARVVEADGPGILVRLLRELCCLRDCARNRFTVPPYGRGSDGGSGTRCNSSSRTFIRAATVRERLTAVRMTQLTMVETFEMRIRFRPLAAHSKWRTPLFKVIPWQSEVGLSCMPARGMP